jgi:hypothetical protein
MGAQHAAMNGRVIDVTDTLHTASFDSRAHDFRVARHPTAVVKML